MSELRHLLPPVGRYFKAGLHTHSTISDGRLSPQELKDLYKSKGYSILSLTDHNVVADHSNMNEPDFLMLTGIEVNTSQVNANPWMKTYHLNLIAKRPDIVWQPYPSASTKPEAAEYLAKATPAAMDNTYNIENVNAIIAEANRQGYLVFYNHPGWSLQNYTDYAPLKGLWGMELCNYSSIHAGFDDLDNSVVYRDMLNQGNRLVPLGTDDSHSVQDACGAWIMVGAEKLEYGSVIQALENGDLYASTGPEIYGLTIEGDILTVRCSDARQVRLEASTRFARSVAPVYNDGLLREAKFDLSPWRKANLRPEDWLRIVVHGPYGHYASTRAYFTDELF